MTRAQTCVHAAEDSECNAQLQADEGGCKAELYPAVN